MATFNFTNVSNERKLVRGAYDAPVNPVLGFDADYAPVKKAGEDFAIAAGDVKIPMYDLGVHGFAVVHAGETLTVEAEKAAEIAFYSEVACQLKDSDCIKVEVEGVEPHTPKSI